MAAWDEHPVIELIGRGARVTINSDDPMFFGCSVAGDLRQVASLVELDVERHTLYAIDASFTSDEEKEHLRTGVSDWWQHRAAEGGTGA